MKLISNCWKIFTPKREKPPWVVKNLKKQKKKKNHYKQRQSSYNRLNLKLKIIFILL